jgi:hypothetical protein
MKHKRTTRNKKLRGDELDGKSLKHWRYGRAIAKEVTLRKEYKQLKRAGTFTD